MASKPDPNRDVNPNPAEVQIPTQQNPVVGMDPALSPVPISANINALDTGGVNSVMNHAFSDVDGSILSLHHTLGNRAGQSAPGNHDHNGQLGVNIPATAIEDLHLAALGSFTPVWATSGATQPVIGNGHVTTQYFKLGALVMIWFDIAAGTTTTFGSAGTGWTFTLPFPQDGSFPGSAAALIHNNAKDWTGSIKLGAGSTFQIAADNNDGTKGSTLIGTSTNDPSGSAWLANSFFARVQYNYVTTA